MDEDSYEIIKFFNLGFAFIVDITHLINSLNFDSILTKYKLEKLDEEPLLKKLKIYPELIKKIKLFKNWLRKNKIEVVENETKHLTDFLEKLINEFENLSEDKERGYLYSYKFIESTFSSHLYLINLKIFELMSGIKHYIDNKSQHLYNAEKLYYGEGNKDYNEIYKGYKEILSKPSLGISQKFLMSSRSSFANGIIQLSQSYFANIYISSKFEESVKNKLNSFLISSLFLLVSAHEKIIFSIAYNEGLECDEKYIEYSAALKSIKEKNKDLYKKLEDTDRKSEIYSARNWRNANTHRIARFTLKEIEGKLVSILKEIKRLLNIYKERLNI